MDNNTNNNGLNSKELEEFFREKLQEQYNRGIKVGIMTVSKLISEKLSDSSKPFMTRVAEVKKFCATPWGNKKIEDDNKETEEINKQTNEELKTIETSEDKTDGE